MYVCTVHVYRCCVVTQGPRGASKPERVISTMCISRDKNTTCTRARAINDHGGQEKKLKSMWVIHVAVYCSRAGLQAPHLCSEVGLYFATWIRRELNRNFDEWTRKTRRRQ